ncbi:Elicitor-responsive protein 3 [Tetrabaena socialis]|uniref:Elicitor-responsive protein 3 n=1 Tax=Tetrabaena socialis TaxID=47790 RepID=A0A2J8A3V7_9CHLO|nr:Elicitor-responsive protein 3 [Tetrabaena socialis]|eukprot:PNH07195.1 Elicitor-responsive protein 3 [Tetrabaena socialis]
MALDAGILRVTLQYAAEIKDCDWFGRQDPYCKLRVGGQERRSRTCIDGGRRPVWNETFEFNIINENGLELTLMDEDTLARDDLIGTASASLAVVRERGSASLQLPVSSGKGGKQRGFVQVSLTFTPNNALRPGGQYAPYQQPYQQPCQHQHPQQYQAPYQQPYGYPPAPSFAYGAYPPPPSPAPSFAYGYPPPAPSYYPPPSAPSAPQYAPAWSPAYPPAQAAPAAAYGMPPTYYGQAVPAYGAPR